MANLTVKATLAAVRLTGATCKRLAETSEYRVNLPFTLGGTEDTAHYTPCAEDAIGTALAMMEQHQRNMPDFCLKQNPLGIATLAPFVRNIYATTTVGRTSNHQPKTVETLLARLATLPKGQWVEAVVTRHGSLYVRVYHSYNLAGKIYTNDPFMLNEAA